MKYLYAIIITILSFGHNAFAQECVGQSQIRVYGEVHGSKKALNLAKRLGEDAAAKNSIILYEAIASNYNESPATLDQYNYHFANNNDDLRLQLSHQVFGLEDHLVKAVALLGAVQIAIQNNYNGKIATDDVEIQNIEYLLRTISKTLTKKEIRQHFFNFEFTKTEHKFFANQLINDNSSDFFHDFFHTRLLLQTNDVSQFIEFLALVHDRATKLNYEYIDLSSKPSIKERAGSRASDYIVAFSDVREQNMSNVIKKFACESQFKYIHVLVGVDHLEGIKKTLAAAAISNSVSYYDLN